MEIPKGFQELSKKESLNIRSGNIESDGVTEKEPEIQTELVEIDGEEVLCKRIDLFEEYGKEFENADSFRKTAKVTARQATKHEEISTGQDGMKNYAEPGDWILQNPGDKDPYVFGDKNDDLKLRQSKFEEKYEPITDEPGNFRSKGVIKALRVDENLVFDLSWGGQMGVKKGGWVADGGYAIAEDSFANTYEKIEDTEKTEDK